MIRCSEKQKKLLNKRDMKMFVMICVLCVMLNTYMTVDIVMNCLIIIGTFALLKVPKETWGKRQISKEMDIIMLLGLPVYVLMVCSGEHILTKEYISFNYSIIVVTTVVVFLIFRKITWAVNIVVTFYVVLFLVNELLLQFRGSFFLPTDIFSVKTAFSVSGNYVSSMSMNCFMLRLLLSLGAIYVFTNKYGKLQYKEHTQKKMYSFYAKILAILCVCVVGIGVISSQKFDLNLFYTEKTVKNIGYIGFFCVQLENIFMDKPKGYEVTEMQEYLEEQEEIVCKEELPNVIVIMNEAFADFSQFGLLPVNKDALPFIHGLEENTKKGNVYVSTWGGNTCNTEFEFLTGNTMKFCPDTVPYVQFLKDETYSIAKYFKEIGYDTQGIHPYYETGYCRNIVYPLMGIDKFYSGSLFDEDYETMEFDSRMTVETLNEKPKGLYIRELISDKATYSKIMEMYEERDDADKPLFTFCVTMQNHSPYTYEGEYEKNIVFQSDNASKEYVTQYLSVLYESDRAFEELLHYFQEKDEKTIILMFGDHQPVLGSAFYNYMYGHEESYEGWSEQEIRMRYQVPYIIWKNYETSSEKSALENRYPVLSSNYLSLMLLEEAGLPLNNWYKFLKEVYNEYPVVSCSGIQNKEGQWLEDEKTTIEESPELLKYNQLQYYRMFDE